MLISGDTRVVAGSVYSAKQFEQFCRKDLSKGFSARVHSDYNQACEWWARSVISFLLFAQQCASDTPIRWDLEREVEDCV